MKPKRYRSPKQIPGMLRALWSKLPDEDPGVVYTWGEGCSKSDAHLLHECLCCQRHYALEPHWSPSFVDQLKARGYDITTLQFSIRKSCSGNDKIDYA